MGGLNLEVAKFGMYVMFPIGIMFYFGTNLDNRFSVPDFWPRPEECNKVPKDRAEIVAEHNRYMALRRAREERKRAMDMQQQHHEQQQQHNGGGESRS